MQDAIKTDSPTRKRHVFLSYAHEDERFLGALCSHLSPLVREEQIEIWYDRKLKAGARVNDAISEQLQDSDIILLLISADFINSTYCYNVELKFALEMHAKKRAIVIPVIIRECAWQLVKQLSELLTIPHDGKAIESWENPNEGYAQVARYISDVLMGDRALSMSHGGLVSAGTHGEAAKGDDSRRVVFQPVARETLGGISGVRASLSPVATPSQSPASSGAGAFSIPGRDAGKTPTAEAGKTPASRSGDERFPETEMRPFGAARLLSVAIPLCLGALLATISFLLPYQALGQKLTAFRDRLSLSLAPWPVNFLAIIALLAAGISFVLCAYFLRNYMRKNGGTASGMYGYTSKGKRAKAGGLTAVSFCIVAACSYPVTHGLGLLCFLTCVLFAGNGFFDDRRNNALGHDWKRDPPARSRKIKISMALIVAVVAVLCGRTAQTFEWYLVKDVLVCAFMIVWCAYAANLTDGMDDLLPSLAQQGFGVLAVLGTLSIMKSGTATPTPYLSLCIIAIGTLIGARFFTANPSMMPLGHCGSDWIGAVLGLMIFESGTPMLLVIATPVMIAEVLSVILQVGVYRYTGGKRLFRCAPIHHHFHLAGWAENQVVSHFRLAGLILSCLLALAWFAA